jgi:DNA polymerase-3 subunit delta
MSPDEAISAARNGNLKPVYLLLGEERLLRNEVVSALRQAATEGGVPGFNEDEYTAGDTPIGTILGAARTAPMMAKSRWVLVRSLERLEAKTSDGSRERDSPEKSALDQLAEYASHASPSSVVVLCADKLNAKRRLVTAAKKLGCLVECAPLSRRDLPRWIRDGAKRRGNAITASAAELIAEISGTDLATLDDLLERLSLFAGEGSEITEDTVGELVPVVRPATVWQLVDAVGRRDRGTVLTLLERVYDPQDRGLRLLGVLAWSTRQMIRFQAALAAGQRGAQAAKSAGVPPFRAQTLEQQVRRLPPGVLEEWLIRLREVDLALKGGSKRPPRAVLETALIDLCGHQRGL